MTPLDHARRMRALATGPREILVAELVIFCLQAPVSPSAPPHSAGVSGAGGESGGRKAAAPPLHSGAIFSPLNSGGGAWQQLRRPEGEADPALSR